MQEPEHMMICREAARIVGKKSSRLCCAVIA
jgi:hypothetical protein